MKKTILHFLSVLALGLTFTLSAAAQDAEGNRPKCFAEFFAGYSTIQTPLTESNVTSIYGEGTHGMPIGIDLTVLIPKTPLGIGFIGSQIMSYDGASVINQESEQKVEAYFFGPTLSLNAFSKKRHVFQIGAGAGLKVDNRAEASTYTYCQPTNQLAYTATVSYIFKINKNNGIGIRANAMSFNNIKETSVANPFVDIWSVSLCYSVFAF